LDTKGILLAEDDFQIRMLLVELLKAEGYTVFEAEDGEQAVQLYEQNSSVIGLLLLDLGLPKLTGVEVFKKIREQKPGIKIIAMSGWGQRETVDELYDEGINTFIQKPYRPAEIIETIRKVYNE
jgi:two-component system, cell cycle sensor histidine kinase and response regulator CckA